MKLVWIFVNSCLKLIFFCQKLNIQICQYIEFLGGLFLDIMEIAVNRRVKLDFEVEKKLDNRD